MIDPFIAKRMNTMQIRGKSFIMGLRILQRRISMKLTLVLLIMLVGAYTVGGTPETRTIGPYNVSFDMNTTANYSILIAKPIVTPASSTYLMMVKTNNSSYAQVAIIENKNLSDSNLIISKLQAETSLIRYGFTKNTSSIDMKIDGKNGFIFGGLNLNKVLLLLGSYWLDSQDCNCCPVSVGKTKVELISSYPPTLTRNLVSSLHIEKSKQKEQPKTLVFAPPK
jgi:hypothetical protein